VKTGIFRLWLGPQIGIKKLDSKFTKSQSLITGLEYGAVLGLNFHVSNNITLTAELGYKEGTSIQVDNNNVALYDIEETRNYFNLGILYRLDSDN